MTTATKSPLQHLLERERLEALLAPYQAVAPHLRWTVLRPDGRPVFAPGDGADSADAGIALPLTVDETHAGTLLVHGAGPGDAPLAAAVQRTLEILLSEALARRGIAAEVLGLYRELNLLYRVSETLGGTLDADAVASRLLTECARALKFDAGMVFLGTDAPGTVRTPVAVTGMDAPAADLGAPALQLLEQVLAQQQPDMCVVAPGGQSRNGTSRWEALLCVPLQVKGQMLGAILLARNEGAPEFSAADEKLLTTLGGQAAVLLENTRLHQTALVAERLEHELRLAYEVQASLIPHHVPEAEGWQFAAWWQPAREVSGDFYDFIPMEGALGVVVGDVTDKGMPSALFMANTRSIIRASTTVGQSPADSLTHANRLLAADSVDSMFVTLFYAQVRLETREVVYVNGGHNPPLWFRNGQEAPVPLKRTGIMLGVDDGARYGEGTIKLEPGEFLVLYTDGLTEAVNGAGERFGEPRFRQVLQHARGAAPHELVAATQAALREFTGTAPAYDDITLVVVRCG